MTLNEGPNLTPLHRSQSLYIRIPSFKGREESKTFRKEITEEPDEKEESNPYRKKITEDPELSHTSRKLSHGQDSIKAVKFECTSTHHDGDATTVRQRPGASNIKIPDQAGVEQDSSMSGGKAPREIQEVPSSSVMDNDGWKLIKTTLRLSILPLIDNDGWKIIKTTLRLQILHYLLWKWLLPGYVAWLAVTYLVTFISRSATAALAPMCSIPLLGPQIPFCCMSFESEGRPVNISKVTTSQDVLTIVMDGVGRNFDLARDMVGHEFAVRDLRIRVMASNLSRKKELTRELESLIRYTKQTSKGLSRFTARVGKSIDTIQVFDEYAVKALEDIANRRNNLPTIPSRFITAISPFAAFSIANPGSTEEQVKGTFITTATRISGKINLLIEDSFELAHDLERIEETLDRIKEISVDEIGDLPRMDILGALWARLAHPDDYEEHKSHTSLLTDMTEFYEKSSEVMKETTAALNHVQAELSEFRDEFATPGLILKDNPLEIIIALLKRSGQRLETGKLKLERIEEGQRPQNIGVRTVTATLV